MVMYIILVGGHSREGGGGFVREATPLPGALWGVDTYTPFTKSCIRSCPRFSSRLSLRALIPSVNNCNK